MRHRLGNRHREERIKRYFHWNEKLLAITTKWEREKASERFCGDSNDRDIQEIIMWKLSFLQSHVSFSLVSHFLLDFSLTISISIWRLTKLVYVGLSAGLSYHRKMCAQRRGHKFCSMINFQSLRCAQSLSFMFHIEMYTRALFVSLFAFLLPFICTAFLCVGKIAEFQHTPNYWMRSAGYVVLSLLFFCGFEESSQLLEERSNENNHNRHCAIWRWFSFASIR